MAALFYYQDVHGRRDVVVEKKIVLPQWKDILFMLRSCHGDDHAYEYERLFPLIEERLYADTAEKTGAEIGDALIDAIRQYIRRIANGNDRLLGSQAVIMSHWMGSYLGAIAYLLEDDVVSAEMLQRCENRRGDLVT